MLRFLLPFIKVSRSKGWKGWILMLSLCSGLDDEGQWRI
jgi:hypothetical protein